ncbi:bifunctional DNA-formamidopyrimidine glycosylase/DNA-(apurinic or apyrimidinic site) lyase [Arthrobacter sp. Br18]|uniref:bifunctional DNA-formamidopyrimidine glycosylase/DNA-(apurinic or apyrimidinic site) lyase n=1 Tax=Arthrobacter sp. Br18 TaxID=1312954 RepID=UPI00047A698A|nr:bifunctional DNA-formamidopyrimidine glycosylase/DNA-(apurinic or apyrimidinic site) lyase [Arthrobacter sp. Br18]
MPELPEVEVVRRGLARWVTGRIIDDVEVLDRRSLRRHTLGAEDFRGNLVGYRVTDVVRRGKFLWMPLGGEFPDGEEPVALLAHLGMSGQLLIEDTGAPDEKHLKVRITLSEATDPSAGDAGGPDDDGTILPRELRFIDQRIFGGMSVTSLQPTADGKAGGRGISGLPLIPREASHIARDPLDPDFSFEVFFARLRARRSGIKRALLDQGLISGIGNIYADEALWAAKLHYARATGTLRRPEALRLVEACRNVMIRALDAGGTSFDSLYVNVNGASGYFERSLEAYGREGRPCRRCAEENREILMRRETFMNRSSFSCPHCQPTPRGLRG